MLREETQHQHDTAQRNVPGGCGLLHSPSRPHWLSLPSFTLPPSIPSFFTLPPSLVHSASLPPSFALPPSPSLALPPYRPTLVLLSAPLNLPFLPPSLLDSFTPSRARLPFRLPPLFTLPPPFPSTSLIIPPMLFFSVCPSLLSSLPSFLPHVFLVTSYPATKSRFLLFYSFLLFLSHH